MTGFVINKLELANHITGVVGGGLHGHHAGRLLGRHVLGHRLVDQGLDVTQQQLIDDGLRELAVRPMVDTDQPTDQVGLERPRALLDRVAVPPDGLLDPDS